VGWGDLRRHDPVDDDWGFGRGTPVDRWYLARFFESHRFDICGWVLEVASPLYAHLYGSGIERLDILDVDPGNVEATIVADLDDPGSLAAMAFDCVICTQTLQYVRDLDRALANLWQCLAPGGVLLLSVPAIQKRDPSAKLLDRWRVLPHGMATLVDRVCPGAEHEVTGAGNLLAAVAGLYGLAAEELTPDELDAGNDDFPLLTLLRVRKPVLGVSVVLPCYNGERWLEAAIESIRAQTRPVQEIIVVDDGSTDHSRDIARACGVRLIEHGTNRGEGAARNTGIRAATGDLIAWLDVDDRWRPRHVEVVGGMLERTPDAVAGFGAVQAFGLNDQIFSGYVPQSGAAETVLVEAFSDWLHIPTGAIVRRSALLEIGGFDETERYAVDFDVWLRLARGHRFVATDEVTADWRWHADQMSVAPQRQYAAVYRYRRRFLDQLASEGDPTRCAELENVFRTVWLEDLNTALDARDQETFRAVASRASLVHNAGRTRRIVCALAAPLPIALVATARDARDAIRIRVRNSSQELPASAPRR
jgi:glycosyltransferase involved in cell wall biosynthesis